MKAYQYFYRVIAAIITLLGLWLAFAGLTSGNLVQVGTCVFVSFLFWFGAFKAGKSNRRDIAISCAVPALLSFPIVYRLFERAVFVFENGGMERADGYGSPLAFVVGLSFELVLFLPLVCLFLVGLLHFFRGGISHANRAPLVSLAS